MRDWEAGCAPLLTARLRAKRRGQAGGRWDADETSVKVNGSWCSPYRAIDRERQPRQGRAQRAARYGHGPALELVGQTPEQVTTDGQAAYPRAIRATVGDGVDHRTNRYKNTRLAHDHRGVKQRYSFMRGFGAFASAARCCVGFAEQRRYFRAQTRATEAVSPAERRCRFRERWATVLAEMAVA